MALNLGFRTLKDFLTGKPYPVAMLDYGNGNLAAAHGAVDTTGAVVTPARDESLQQIHLDLLALRAKLTGGS